MTNLKLGKSQIFSIRKYKNLEKLINDYYQQTKDSVHIIYCAIAISVRNGLSASDFSFVAKDLIRSLFLENEEVRTIPLSCVYFRDYFNESEWTTVVNRLFNSQEEFEQLTESTRAYIEDLRPLLISGENPTKKKTNMLSYFKDGNGKRHSWSLSNVNPNITKDQHYALLSILGTLNIFEKDGVRRFVEPIYADFLTYESGFDRRNEEEAADLREKAGKLLPITTQSAPVEENTVTQDPSNQEVPLTHGLHDSINERDANAKRDFLLKEFDPSSVSQEELPDLAMKAILEGKSLRDMQLEQEKQKEQVQTQTPSVKKTLTREERIKQLQELRRGKKHQNKRRGKKRK
ncbi:hypothetical protein [Candidatus Enterococcus ferrettii]|uniref:Uncharacterized protein n=1 Tax=Candidatus Enterococcus ferrettii TaxID=2815324 RepID=A0ABV0EXS1_9ENTE